MAAKMTLQHIGEELFTIPNAFFFDLPLANARWGLGRGTEKEVTEALWRGYDAWVCVATALVDGVSHNMASYDNRSFRFFTDWLLRWQRLSNALTGVFFTKLRQATGLATAAGIHSLSTQVEALRAEIRLSFTDASSFPELLPTSGRPVLHPPRSLHKEFPSPLLQSPRRRKGEVLTSEREQPAKKKTARAKVPR
jgi:hypothetical protein